MTMPTVVAFSWGAGRYHEAAEKLRQDCHRHGIPERIRVNVDLTDHFRARPGPNWVDYRWCYRYIPTLLAEALDEGPEDVLYLHADYRIRQPPPADAFADLDVGLQRRWAWRPEVSTFDGLAAPIFVRNNDRARRFVRLYRAVCAELDDNEGEHRHLERVFSLFQDKDRTCRVDWFPVNIASQSRDADCPIVGHKRERK